MWGRREEEGDIAYGVLDGGGAGGGEGVLNAPGVQKGYGPRDGESVMYGKRVKHRWRGNIKKKRKRRQHTKCTVTTINDT